MAGERLLQVRLDQCRTADGHAQSNEAALFRAQRRITNPHCRLRSKLRDRVRQDAGRIPHTSFGGIQAQSGPLPEQSLQAAVEQCDPVG